MDIICVTLIIITALIAIVIINTNIFNYKKSIRLPEKSMSVDDSIVQAKRIGEFLADRYETIGCSALKMSDTGVDPVSADRIISGEDSAITDLIRICHGCGCEISIKQVSSSDIEQPIP